VWKTKYSYPVLRNEIGLYLRDILKQMCDENEMSVVRGNVRAKRYIENQDDSPQGFEVWDEDPSPPPSAEPAFRPLSKPSPLGEGR
jgi:hypothetical protein